MILLVILPISSTDIFISALPAMMKDFHCNVSDISYTLSGYMVGFAISIVLSGTCSDLLGRKKILVWTTIIYLISAFLMSICTSLHLLIFLRVMQGFGGGGGFVIARLIVKDYFQDKEQLKILSMLSTGNAIAPAIAPQVGTFFAHHFGWHSCFLVTFIMSCLALLLIIFFLQETLKTKSSYNPLKSLPFSLFTAMRKKEFVGYTVLIGCGWSAYFIFIGLSSFYFQNLAHYSAKEYSYIILVVTFGYLIGTNLTRYFNHKNYTIPKILSIAVLICVLSTIVFTGAIIFNLFLIAILAMFVLRLGIGIIMPTAQLGAMRVYNKNIGWYMGCLFCLEFLASGILLSVASHIEEIKTGYGMLIIIALSVFMLIPSYKLLIKKD